LSVERDESVCLELRQSDVLGDERVGPPELIGDLPGDVLKDAVTEQAISPSSACAMTLVHARGKGPLVIYPAA
jgi:hypothetical protein